MKTNNFSSRNAKLYSLIGFMSILVASCGSYQNSSYYDGDGIYGNSPRATQNISSNHYKEYFSSLQNENSALIDTIQNSDQGGYPSWGSNPTTTSVNVYTNPWSMSIGFGLGYGFGSYGYGYNSPYYDYGWGGYPYYGYGYGYGYPYYSYGWGNPYYGYGFPYYSYGYGYNNNYSYNTSRRGSSYTNGVNSSRYSQTNNRYSQTNTNEATNYSNRRSTTRNSSSFITRDYNTQSQSNSTNSNTRTRNNTNTNSSRSENYTPARSYDNTPSSNSYNTGGRSSGGSSSYGGSNGGGGRSSSGGSGRR